MALTRAQIKQQIRILLGTSSDDPQFSDTILDPIVQQSVDSLIGAIQDANPDFLSKIVTLAADSATGLTYTFASQANPITDFAKWLEVRYVDQDGLELDECRAEEMMRIGGDCFVITGEDETPVLTLSSGSQVGGAVWFRYGYWPAELVDDNSVPTGISSRFHDVIALEALFVFGLGGEQRRPPELSNRWLDRRAQLLARVGRRGVTPSRTRVYPVGT